MSKELTDIIKNLDNSYTFIKQELFRQTEFMHSLADNQRQLEDTMLQLLREYKSVRNFEKTFRAQQKNK